MISVIFTLGVFHLASGLVDPSTGIWAPPPSFNDVFYPVDDAVDDAANDNMPMGFHEIPPPMKQEWKLDGAVASFAAKTTFKYKFVTKGGQISDTNPGNAIEVAATGSTSDLGHTKGAEIVATMLSDIGQNVWNNMVARRVRIGIFSRHEALSVYPEYRDLADSPRCRGSCRGSCKRTCTFDGRKWDTVAGAGGVRAAILESNILCDRFDPYRRGNNILAHEFIHTIHINGLPSAESRQLNAAFAEAKRKQLWNLKSYAMQTVYEYFAEAGGVWFNVNNNNSSGGMDRCRGEMVCRSHLKRRDPKLYAMLKYTFSPADENKPGNLKICI